MRLVPPELVDRPKDQPGFTVFVEANTQFWIGEDWFGTTSLGRLPAGQSYLRTVIDPIDPSGEQPPPRTPPTVPAM